MVPKLLLSRSTSDALLNSKIYLPRVGTVQCEHCGCSQSVYSRHQPARPFSLHADQENYIRLSYKVGIEPHYKKSRKCILLNKFVKIGTITSCVIFNK